MKPILKSIRLDHDILKVYYRTFLVVAYGLAILITVLAKRPAWAIVVVLTISAPVVGLYFLLYEKNNLSQLYGILPLGKKEVVIGRYLYALAFGIVNGIAASILAYIVSLFVNSPMSQLEFFTFTFASFVYFCLYIAIQFPLYFKFPFSKVYLFSNLPVYLIAVAAYYMFRKDHLLQQPLQQAIHYFTANPNRIWMAGLGLGLLLLLVSCPLSCLDPSERGILKPKTRHMAGLGGEKPVFIPWWWDKPEFWCRGWDFDPTTKGL